MELYLHLEEMALPKSLGNQAESAVRLDGDDRRVVRRKKARGSDQKGVTSSDVGSLQRVKGEQYRKGRSGMATVDAACGVPDTISHRCNNLLQTAISALDLLQCRLEQGRLSELTPLIQRIETSLGKLAAFSGRIGDKMQPTEGLRDDLD
jgi:hypothetical protein